MKLAFSLFLILLPIKAQNSVFAASGVSVAYPTSGLYSLGVAHAMTSNTSLLLDVMVTPNAPTHAQATTIVLGAKQNLPQFTASIGKLKFTATPFFIVAYGATLIDVVNGSALQGITKPSALTPAAIVGALSTAPKMTQQYALGFEIVKPKYNWGFAARVQKETGVPPIPEPFIFISKSFKGI